MKAVSRALRGDPFAVFLGILMSGIVLSALSMLLKGVA